MVLPCIAPRVLLGSSIVFPPRFAFALAYDNSNPSLPPTRLGPASWVRALRSTTWCLTTSSEVPRAPAKQPVYSPDILSNANTSKGLVDLISDALPMWSCCKEVNSELAEALGLKQKFDLDAFKVRVKTGPAVFEVVVEMDFLGGHPLYSCNYAS